MLTLHGPPQTAPGGIISLSGSQAWRGLRVFFIRVVYFRGLRHS